MHEGTATILIQLGLITGGLVIASLLLSVLWAREQVKKDLRAQGLSPINVRWVPFAFWTWGHRAAFSATFVDSTGLIQTGRCSVWWSRVSWISDDVRYLDRNLPWTGRVIYTVIALALFYFGIKHLITGNLVLPPSYKQIHPHPTIVEGWPLILACAAAFSQAASLGLAVAYYYRQRANEQRWIAVARGLSILSGILFAISLGVYSFESFRQPG